MTRSILLFASVALLTGAAAAQINPEAPATENFGSDSESERAAVVERFATVLEDNFVLPDVGRRYAQALRTKLAAGGYSGLGDRFSETIVADLQAIHSDRHLRMSRGGEMAGPVRVMRRPGNSLDPSAGEPQRIVRRPDPANAVGRAGWIADGVALIELNLFPGDPQVVTAIERFLDTHRSARTIIFDIRGHRGGGLAEMDSIFSRIYGRETALLGMDTRIAVAERGEPLSDSHTLRPVSGPEGVRRRMHYAVPGPHSPLRDARIFLLTSSRSASAAEHFALALKSTGRAVLIGETTAGAGHYGMQMALGSGYSAFIPVGRTFDPDTNQGWEGRGVAPDVQVPADEALDEALRRAGVDPRRRREVPVA
jgi:hypothetical protein